MEKSRNPIKLYMPEQAMSIVKFIGVPSGLIIDIIGLPYSLVNIAGMPIRDTIPLDAWELRKERVPPTKYRISVGGGAKKNRKSIGNASWRSVFTLNRTRINEATNTGSVIM